MQDSTEKIENLIYPYKIGLDKNYVWEPPQKIKPQPKTLSRVGLRPSGSIALCGHSAPCSEQLLRLQPEGST